MENSTEKKEKSISRALTEQKSAILHEVEGAPVGPASPGVGCVSSNVAMGAEGVEGSGGASGVDTDLDGEMACDSDSSFLRRAASVTSAGSSNKLPPFQSEGMRLEGSNVRSELDEANPFIRGCVGGGSGAGAKDGSGLGDEDDLEGGTEDDLEGGTEGLGMEDDLGSGVREGLGAGAVEGAGRSSASFDVASLSASRESKRVVEELWRMVASRGARSIDLLCRSITPPCTPAYNTAATKEANKPAIVTPLPVSSRGRDGCASPLASVTHGGEEAWDSACSGSSSDEAATSGGGCSNGAETTPPMARVASPICPSRVELKERRRENSTTDSVV